MPAVRLLGRMVIRLFSTAMLAGLLVGIPYGLVTEIGWPLPRTLPTSASDLERILTNPVTDDVVIKLLAVAMWLVWFSFAASLLAEVAATIRGVELRRLPVVAPVQALAGWLLSGATAGVIATATLTTTATVPVAPAPPVHGVVDLPHRLDEVERVAITLTAEQEALPEKPPVLCAGEHVLVVDGKRYAYLVQRGDSLWAIAEQCLGDGHKWPEIWELNKARDFPGVGGSLYDPDLIYPGWDLYLPEGAVPPPGAHEANSADEAEVSPEPPPVTPSPAPPPPAIPPDLDEPSGHPPPAVIDPSHASPTPQATPAPATSGTVDDPGEQAATDKMSDDRSLIDAALPVTAVLATAGLLAALVVGRLRRRRGRQLRHRRHGRRITEPDPAAETAVRVAAQPADVERLDHALRALGAALHDRSIDHLPDIVAVWLDIGTVHLLLARPRPDPPAPFVAGVDGMTWVLPADAALPDADGRISPLPALVTIASQPGGQHLLVDLERAGVLTITGDPERRLDLLRYIASELATSEWADEVELVLVGFSPEETEHLIALNEERVRAATSLPDALARVRRRIAANTAALADSGAGNAFTARVNDIVVDAWMPHVLLIADPTSTLPELDAQMQDSVRCAVAVAAAAEQTSAWSVRVDPSSKLRVDWLSITDAYAARLPADQLARLAPMLRTARTLLTTDPGEQAAGVNQVDEPVPPADSGAPWAEGTDEHGHLLSATIPDHQVEPEQANGTELPATDPVDSDPVLEASRRPADGKSEPERSPVVDQPIALPDPTDNGTTGTGAESSGGRLQPVVAVSESTLRPKPAATPPTGRRRRAPADPDLDADLQDWHASECHRPRIAILGPVAVDAPGQPPAERLRFYSEVVVYLALRGARGASSDQLDDALWPERRVSYSSRRVAMTKVRRWLGENADGDLWLPPNMGANRVYRINDGYLLDWHLFRRLRARGEARGTAGAADLRRALELVRGAPLEGADRPYAAGNRNPYTWLPTSGIQPHHLASAVVDVSHQLVNLYLDAGDATAARWAVEKAWLADPDRLNDQPWLDLMRITAEEGHTSELRTLVDQLVLAREVEVPEELSPDTYREVDRLAGHLLRIG